MIHFNAEPKYRVVNIKGKWAEVLDIPDVESRFKYRFIDPSGASARRTKTPIHETVFGSIIGASPGLEIFPRRGTQTPKMRARQALVARCEWDNRSGYGIFGLDDLMWYLTYSPEDMRILHEVIPGFYDQKMKFDIDMKEEHVKGFMAAICSGDCPTYAGDLIGHYAECYEYVTSEVDAVPSGLDAMAYLMLSIILDAIIKCANDAGLVDGCKLEPADFATYSSCGPAGGSYKWSFHIICQAGYFTNATYVGYDGIVLAFAMAREFSERVRAKIGQWE